MIDVLGDDGREKTLRGPGPRGGVGDLGPQVARQVGVDHGDLGAEAARVQRIEGRLDLVLHREEDDAHVLESSYLRVRSSGLG